jgi:light-harvesting complex 1 beta chain
MSNISLQYICFNVGWKCIICLICLYLKKIMIASVWFRKLSLDLMVIFWTDVMTLSESFIITVSFWFVFSLGFVLISTIALVGTMTGLPWRSWLPGAESCKSVFGGVLAAVYSILSQTS